jgi:hypothetical protein
VIKKYGDQYFTGSQIKCSKSCMKLQVLNAEMSVLGVLGGNAGNRTQVVQSEDTNTGYEAFLTHCTLKIL